MTRKAANLLIMDACVLIDYIKTDRSVLALFSQHVGQAYVLNEILKEVRHIEPDMDLREIGLELVEPEIEDLFLAGANQTAESFQDKLCILTAKRHGYTCVTNDKNLRRLCRSEDVSSKWGLELLLDLYAELRNQTRIDNI